MNLNYAFDEIFHLQKKIHWNNIRRGLAFFINTSRELNEYKIHKHPQRATPSHLFSNHTLFARL